jgi:uncharacterized protein involved in exopolysaccharide biosynthesis
MAEVERHAEEAALRDRPGSPRAITDFFDFVYLRSVLRRRFWIVFVIGAVLSLLAFLIAFVLPPIYRSSATILVESQQIPTELARSTVTASAVEQIQVIEQRLMTRATLLELAERHGMFADQDSLTPSEQVQKMREAIRFDLRIFDGRGSNVMTAVAFDVSVTAGNGGVAAAVANDLVTRILAQNARLRQARAEMTSAFFRQEVDRLGRELDALGAEIVRFQKENEAALPDNLAYRRGQLDLMQERLQRFELRRAEIERDKSLLGLTIDEEMGGAPITLLQRDLEGMRRTLVQRRALLSPTHPEVRALEAGVAALEAAIADEPAAPAPGETAEVSAREARIARRVAIYDAQLQVLDAQIATLDEERERVERSILDTPSVEMQINTLRRKYDDLEAEYQSAQAKLAQAIIGERLETRQQAERFEVIEQPTVPEEPQSPNRLKIVAAGVVAGFGAGGGLAALLELMSRIVRRPEDLETIEIEPLGVIPYIETAGERLRRWSIRLMAFLLVFGGVSAGLWAAHTRYLPLDVIAQKAVDKAGLQEPIDLFRRRLGL